jgi:hypothetical protein
MLALLALVALVVEATAVQLRLDQMEQPILVVGAAVLGLIAQAHHMLVVTVVQVWL